MEQKNHEAFCSDFDYSKVCAPYVRLAMRKEGPSGDIVSKFDILFTQPNEEFIPMAGIHTLEHLTAEIGQNILSGLIDFSPMGCRTGFNLTLFGDKTEEEIAKKMLIIFQTIAEWPVDKPVPGTGMHECANYREHDLYAARSWASRWVNGIKTKGWQCRRSEPEKTPNDETKNSNLENKTNGG